MLFLGKGSYANSGGKTSKTTNHEAIYVCSSPCKKHRKHLTAIAALFVPGVAEHRIAESPGRNAPGALYFFQIVPDWGAFFNTHNVSGLCLK